MMADKDSERLERAIEYVLLNAKFGPLSESDTIDIGKLLADYEQSVERATVREAAKLTCKGCRLGEPVHNASDVFVWLAHPEHSCQADAIRNRWPEHFKG